MKLSRMRCPNCDERVRRNALICRYCGSDLSVQASASHENDDDTFGSDKDGQPSGSPDKSIWAGLPWYRSWWVRGPVLGLFLIDAGLASLTPESWVSSPIPVRLVMGALIVFVGGLMVFGLLAWAVLRPFGKKRERGYWRLTLSFPIILFVWLGALGASINRERNNPGQPSILQSTDQTERQKTESKARETFATWLSEYLTATTARLDTLASINRLFLMEQPYSTAGWKLIRRAETSAKAYRFALVDLPSGGPPSVREQTLQSAVEMLNAVKLLIAIPNNPDLAELRGAEVDRLLAHSQKLASHAGRLADSEFRRLGGLKAMPSLETKIKQFARAAQRD